MAPSNKRKRTNQIEEITFDPSARQEYLTGFHKRKQQRIEHAREAAVKREKEERVEERRQVKESNYGRGYSGSQSCSYANKEKKIWRSILLR
jgi:hypothetical protein